MNVGYFCGGKFSGEGFLDSVKIRRSFFALNARSNLFNCSGDSFTLVSFILKLLSETNSLIVKSICQGLWSVEAGIRGAGKKPRLSLRKSHGKARLFSTFEEYCRQRWGFSRPRAYQFIDAAKVNQNLIPIGIKPTHESQLRPLTKLEPKQQKEVWKKAVETAPQGTEN